MRLWAVVPAAGAGRRMAAAVPKQYLTIAGRPVIIHTLEALYAESRLAGVVVCLAPDDSHWETLDPRFGRPLWRAAGGVERCDSVLNGLQELRARGAADGDWVLVHDAARPCLRAGDLAHLIDALMDDPVGGLLAVPVRDTMKRADAGERVAETVDRAGLWHALTPQMFRLGPLRAALAAARAAGVAVTDDAAAMELAGKAPRLVAGHGDNIKITRPEDLPLAEFFLACQERL